MRDEGPRRGEVIPVGAEPYDEGLVRVVEGQPGRDVARPRVEGVIDREEPLSGRRGLVAVQLESLRADLSGCRKECGQKERELEDP